MQHSTRSALCIILRTNTTGQKAKRKTTVKMDVTGLSLPWDDTVIDAGFSAIPFKMRLLARCVQENAQQGTQKRRISHARWLTRCFFLKNSHAIINKAHNRHLDDSSSQPMTAPKFTTPFFLLYLLKSPTSTFPLFLLTHIYDHRMITCSDLSEQRWFQKRWFLTTIRLKIPIKSIYSYFRTLS